MSADVWASGPSGSYHFNGSWQPFFIGSNNLPLNAISGTSPTNVVGVGNSGLIAHYDGSDTSWRKDVGETSDPDLNLYSVSGTGPDDIWAGGIDRLAHYDGSSWTVVPLVLGAPVSPISYRGIWLDQRGQGFACSAEYSAISRLDAGTWSKDRTGPSNHELFSIWGSDPEHAWAVGHGHSLTGFPGKIMKWDGTTWGTDEVPASTPELTGVWGTDANHVWAVGANGTLLFFDGTAWTALFSGTGDNLNAIWGSGPRDIWVAGDGGARHFNGTAWSAIGSLGALTTIWLSAD